MNATLLFLWIAPSCAIWVALSFLAILTMGRISRLDDGEPSPAHWSRVSVIIAACNEERSLEQAIDVLLAEDHPELQIVLIDDRSTDATGRIVDSLAAGDRRITPLHVTELPEGWLGKVHALHEGAKRAGGEWLLFTDADVHIQPGTMRCAVAHAVKHDLDHLSLIPHLRSGSLPADALISSFMRLGLSMLRPRAVANPRSRAAVGLGAFNLVRREALQRSEGFPWLRMEVIDDVGLAMLIKRSGGRSALLDGSGRIGLHWYHTAREAAIGLEKAYALFGCSGLLSIAAALIAALLWTAPFIALGLWHQPWLPAMGGAALLAALASAAAANIWARRPLLPAVLFPVGDLLLQWVFLRATVLGMIRGGVLWRGTLYPSRAIRAGKRTWPWSMV